MYDADRQTDMTKLNVAFRNFTNLSKNGRTDVTVLFLMLCCVDYKTAADLHDDRSACYLPVHTVLPFPET
jgi:hypothetical protein